MWGLDWEGGGPWGQRVWVWGTRQSASESEGLCKGGGEVLNWRAETLGGLDMTALGAQGCTTESELYKPRGKGRFLLFVLSL